MTVDNVIIELQDRFESTNKYDITDITDYLKRHSSTDVEIIYKCIIANHPYKTLPKLPAVKKYLQNDGIDLRSNSDKMTFSCNVCDVCSTKFDIDMSGCPRCKKRTQVKIKVSDKPIQGVRQGHDDCGYCDIYMSSSKGSICESWGKEENAGGNYCNGCTCIECCKKTYMKNNDYARYRVEVLGYDK